MRKERGIRMWSLGWILVDVYPIVQVAPSAPSRQMGGIFLDLNEKSACLLTSGRILGLVPPDPGACIVPAVRYGLHDQCHENTFFDFQYAGAGTTYAQQSFF
jgi:hypothetical protein